MADLDRDLSTRLAGLAAAVPVGRASDPVHQEAVRARQQVRMAWLTPLVVVLLGLILTSALQVGPFAPSSSPHASDASSQEPTVEPTATEPAFRPTAPPRADGSPIDVDRDEAFELRLDPDHRVYASGEPITLHTSFSYTGSRLNTSISHFEPLVAFGVEQVDDAGNPVGEISRSRVYDSSCTRTEARSGAAHEAPIMDHDLLRLRARSVPEGFYSDLESGILRLTEGRWRIRASLSAYMGGICSGEEHSLSAAVELVVVPSTWSRIDMWTANDEPAACLLMFAGGVLAADPTSGIGVVRPGGSRHPVRWAFGWSGWRSDRGVVLMDRDGNLAAREGDRVSWDGLMGTDGTYSFCAGLENLGP